MNEIAAAFIASCRDEIEAPKPGNVHIFAEGHGMTADEFLRSAEAAAPAIGESSASIGDRILAAVEATWASVGMNTNLGIILLCAPLAIAAQTDGDLRSALKGALARLTRADAAAAFCAILRASPAGLGEARRHDVHQAPDATLLEAMRAAADRDRIAYQYAFDFVDVFETGIGALNAARSKLWPAPWPTVAIYLAFLAGFPDSHIARKKGLARAATVQGEAANIRHRFVSYSNPAEALPDLLDFDQRLKADGLNPGTSADLTVATVFADRLTRILIERRNND
ncbi:triphosphoribosyl-dephospho-CoA synthase [Methylocapsa polymorpha]|uniref:Triphosphoribosyl-dephospho-CoA synthase n=1 Tax=Methylocapsa polymorpha TaxID=3080828 RepID=A0ABZ0HP33_9HYPH|nr:triphosphoribosyl-dephospho-CoA synthase [Methylocapsa sp. RX1]